MKQDDLTEGEDYTELTWETVLHVSLTSLHIMQADELTFFLDYLLKDVCTENNLGRQKYIS